MRLASVSPVVFTCLRQPGWNVDVSAWVAALVILDGIHSQQLEGYSLDSACSANETLVDDGVVNTESFEDLGSLV